ncbi:MAG TPA: hypothetical protein VIZ86_16475 [Pseudomonas sp.]
MSHYIETTSPAGRTYLHQPTRTRWKIDLEIGGAVWLTSERNESQQTSLAALEQPEWQRIH